MNRMNHFLLNLPILPDMDLIKAKTILSRLQAMHQELESNPQLSSLERDLILHYLRDLYHIYLEAEVQAMPTIKSPVSAIETLMEKDPVQKTLEFKFDTVEEVIKPNVQIPTIPFPESITEVIITPSFSPEIEKKQEPLKPKEIQQIPIPASTIPTAKTTILRASIQELFDIKKGTELSDKLHELPLKDINRAIGINDRLEYVSTLFGGQKPFFEQTIQELNNLKSFDEAEDILGRGVAVTYKWDHENQKEKATEFIKLIRRRYL